MTDPRYPTGKFVPPAQPTRESRAQMITAIAETPQQLRDAVQGLDEDQLDTPYREGGWTLRQVVHHIPDSHVNAYIRLKLALTEPGPVIKPYDEAAWADLADTTAVPIDVSLNLLDAVHKRFVAVLRSLKDDDFQREYVHPETGRHTLDYLLAMYAWHGPHHIAHIASARARMGW
jgi:uncharacterized damage-inducible protein DinB